MSDRMDRRRFLRTGAAGTLGLLGHGPLIAEAIPRAEPAVRAAAVAPVRCGLIGYGAWGREIADTMSRLGDAELAVVSDTYPVMRTRAERDIAGVTTEADYRAVLDDPSIPAVLVATPTHLHTQIVLDALEAGKHVYCEAPMAASVDEAQAMARAAADVEGQQAFLVGHLYRYEPQYRSVFQFIRSGALGTPTMARAQWHAKESWRRTSPNADRERALNWRLDPTVSLGLAGEQSLHAVDYASWLFDARPTSVTGFGQLMLWDDGRELPDTVQAVYAFPNNVHLVFDATLTSSFDRTHELFYGRDSTILLRDSKAWMFKEVDAPMLGWEVYARKDQFYTEKGIALVANATQLDALDLKPTDPIPGAETPLWYTLQAFLDNIAFGPYPPPAGYREGLAATVVAVKTHEAVTQGTPLMFEDAWFEVG